MHNLIFKTCIHSEEISICKYTTSQFSIKHKHNKVSACFFKDFYHHFSSMFVYLHVSELEHSKNLYINDASRIFFPRSVVLNYFSSGGPLQLMVVG